MNNGGRTLDDVAHEVMLRLIDRLEDLSHPGVPSMVAAAAYAIALAMRTEAARHSQPTTIPINIGADFING